MKQTIFSFFLVMVLLPLTTSAQNNFKSIGTIDSVDFKTGDIVIDDSYYKLGQTVTVYDQKSSMISQNNVKQGKKVGFNLSSSAAAGTNTQTIYELWVLPSNFDLSNASGSLLMPVLK